MQNYIKITIHEENFQMNESNSKEEEDYFHIPENSIGKSCSFSFKLPKINSEKKDNNILSKIYKNNESSLSIISQKKYSEILDGLDENEGDTDKNNSNSNLNNLKSFGSNRFGLVSCNLVVHLKAHY